MVPIPTLRRKDYGGHCERAAAYLSERVASSTELLELYDRFMESVVLPQLKARLLVLDAAAADDDNGSTSSNDDTPTMTFYYQRPPTLRLQPGPARAVVKPHSDSEYGHQMGELNYWVPLTDRKLTQVDLYCESFSHQGDYYRALVANPGEAVSFHGSSCRHYVNANPSDYTRVSFDFRVGVGGGYFDPAWQMAGTTSDHDR